MENYQIIQKIDYEFYYTKMQNSDLVYFNNLKIPFEDGLYNQTAKQRHVQMRRKANRMESIIQQENCYACANKFRSYVAGMFSDKTTCQFCMNYICLDCVYKKGEKDA